VWRSLAGPRAADPATRQTRADLVLLLVLGAIWRLLWIGATIERDEGSFAYVAWTWLRGGLPYVDATTYPGPVTYILYAIPMALFGNTIVPIRILNDLLFLVSLVYVYKLGLRWWGRSAAVAASIAYVLFMNLPVIEGPLAMSESLLTPFLVYSVWAYQRFVDSRANRWLAVSALGGSLATLTKLSAGFGLLLVLLLLIGFQRKEVSRRSSGKNPRRALIHSLLIFFGVAAMPVLVVVAYYTAMGALGPLLDIQLRSAGYVASSHYTPLTMYLMILAEGAPVWAFAGWGVWVAARRRDPGDSIAILWFALLLIPTLVPPSFGHYYIQVAPPACLLAGLGVASLPFRKVLRLPASHATGIARGTRRPALVLGLLVALVAVSAPLQVLQYPNMNFSTPLASWSYADSASYAQQVELASYLAHHVRPGERILVHGWSPEIYWLTDIPAPTKDVWSRPSPDVIIPPERYQQIADVVRFGGARYGVLFGNSLEDIVAQVARDPVAAYLVQDYYLEARIGNAWVFSNVDGAGRLVRWNLALEIQNARLLMGKSLDSASPLNLTFPGNSTFVPRPEFVSVGGTPTWSIVQPLLVAPWAPENRTFVDYSVTVPRNATLKVAIALERTGWCSACDVRFEILVQTSNGTTTAILQATISPRNSSRSPNFLSLEASLTAFEGEPIRLALTTSALQPTNMANLTAYWASPRIFSAG